MLTARRCTGLCALAAFLVLVAAACDGGGSDSGGASNSPIPPLVGTNWILTDSPLLGAGLTVNDVSAHFSTKQVSGSSGCNSYGTGYTVDGSKMTIDPNIVSTRRACEAGPTAVESAYLARLVKVKSYAIKSGTLSLSGTSGTVLLAFTSADAAGAIVGNWSLTSYYTGSAVQSVIVGTEITADFDPASVFGSTGCATYRVAYSVTGSAIAFDTVFTSDGYCADTDRQRQADQYVAALGLARSYHVTASRLDVLRSGGTIAATFERAASK